MIFLPRCFAGRWLCGPPRNKDLDVKIGLTLSCFPQLDATWNDLTPLGLGYLAAYARRTLPEVEFLIERDFDTLLAAKPDIVGFTAVTLNINYCLRQARIVKETLGCPVIVGGPHYSLLPGLLDEDIDIAIMGEGEQTFVELLELYKAEGAFQPQSLKKINGIRYRDGGLILQTPCREHIEDLDTLPFPDRQSTWKKWPRHPLEASIMTSRGCPYNCYFCSTMNYWGRKYRYNSVDYVIRELEEIFALHDPKIVHFYDDLFVGRKDRVHQIMEKIRDRGWHKGVQFRCFVRSNLLDDALMEGFAKSGFEILNIGFESASEAVLQTFNKQSAGGGRNLRAVELARKHGVKLTSSFILGAPGETRDDVLASFEFVTSNADVFHYIRFAPLFLMPGTELWEKGRAHGLDEHHLAGLALEEQDLEDERNFHMNRWTYLNEEQMSREELFNYLQISRGIESMIYKQYELTRQNENLLGECRKAVDWGRQVSEPSFIAEHVPISDIVKAKARRRISRLMAD